MDCIAVIPCFNEAATIGPLVTAVRGHLPRVIVVDDGSTDGTAEAARTAGAEVLSSASSQGKGAALRTGLRRARELGCIWALLLDGDGQHAPEDIPAFLAAMSAGHADLVIGNRMAAPEAMPPVRRLTNRLMSTALSSLSGTQLPDTQCGFRLVRLAVWETLPLQCAHFEVESELLLACLADGRRVEFIPVRSRYQSEHSKIRPVRDTLRWLRWLWRSRGDFARARSQLKLSSAPARKVGRLLARFAGFACLSFLLGATMDWSTRSARRDQPAGFWRGCLHGALMPTTLPTLLVGREVAIYAEHNTGISYKLGYTAGVNGCGALFFGLMFWKPKAKPPPPQP